MVVISACAAHIQREKNDKNLVQIHTQLGAGYMQRGDYDVAEYELKKALAIDSDNSEANNVMGLLQTRLKQYALADQYFRTAVKSQPGNAEAQNNYGAFLCEQGHVDQAIVHFKKALTDPLYKTPQLANLNIGLCLMKKPVPAEATKYFKTALSIDPNLASALFQMAKISADSGQMLSARAYMQRYFEIAGDSPDTLLLAISIERTLGNKDMLASYALRLTGKYPDSPEAIQFKKQKR